MNRDQPRDQPQEHDLSAVEHLVERLGLAPHPEGGFFREVYRATAPGFEFADFEMPTAGEILRLHPQHEAIVRELTRR